MIITWSLFRPRCGAANPPAPGRGVALAFRIRHPTRGRCAGPRGGARRSRRRVRGIAAARRRADRRRGSDPGPAPPRGAAGSDRAQAASTCARGRSFGPQHLDAAPDDAHVHLVERAVAVRIRWAAIRREGCGMARAHEMAVSAIPPQLAGQVGADGRDGREFVSVAEEKGADTAGRDTFALALNEVAHRGDVDPTPIRRSDRIAGVDRLWLESPACKPAGGCPRGQAEPGHERRAPPDPSFAPGLFEAPPQPLAKRGLHTLPTLAGARPP